MTPYEPDILVQVSPQFLSLLLIKHTMILFNLRKLEHQLRNDQVTDKQGMYYLMINTLLYSLSIYIPTGNKATGWILWIEIAAVIISNGAGVYLSYEVNRKGDNKDYFKRFQALVFVIGLRMIVFIILAMLAFSILLHREISDPISDLIFCILLNAYFLIMVIRSFKRISQVEEVSEEKEFLPEAES